MAWYTLWGHCVWCGGWWMLDMGPGPFYEPVCLSCQFSDAYVRRWAVSLGLYADNQGVTDFLERQFLQRTATKLTRSSTCTVDSS